MSKIHLKNSHLWIDNSVAKIFGDVAQVYIVYYPQKKSLLLAPMTDEFFPKLHKAALNMLKTRNLQGDKTISLQGFIIDNEIDDSDRDLEFSFTEGVALLNIII
jgi:hypothetical protein